MLTCVVLNYNDADTTISLYNSIKDYKVFSKIIIVDGASTDDSFKRLCTLVNNKTDVLLAERNGGYGYGNNVGIRHSLSLGAKYVLVANPDVEFSERAVRVCLNTMEKNKDCVAAAPRINARHPAFCFSPSPMKDVLSSSILLNKIFSPRYYPDNFFEGKKTCNVDALPGSLVMFDAEKFAECGLYDEDIFLYNEELIVGKKFKTYGYTSILCLTESYMHFHSVSVGKNYKSAVKPRKILLKSHAIYLRRYCDAGKSAIFVLTLLKPLIYLECLIWPWLKKRLNVRQRSL